MKPGLLEDALRLPLPDRLVLADELYRSIDREVSDSTPPELLTELERRDAAFEAQPATGSTLEAFETAHFSQ
jgi:putative addiction module component (TIGR02574 family)